MAAKLPIAIGRYKMRNGNAVRLTTVKTIKASDGTSLLQAWGVEEIDGQEHIWSGTTGQRLPSDLPGAKNQDLVKRLGR